MQHSSRAIYAAALLAGGGLVAVVAAPPAHADELCDQWGRRDVGDYVVQNNRWNGSQRQCINVGGQSFKITVQNNSTATNGPPVSYPSIYVGCHYNSCSLGTNLPIQVKSIKAAESEIKYTYVSNNAIYDASYDIWLDPQPKKDGVNQMEIMIWLNHQGSIQPIGGKVVDKVTISNQDWQVWSGSNGQNNVVSYVALQSIPSIRFNVLDFLADVRNRGKITDEFYLTSIQAGFEPWQGGVGLAVDYFSAIVK